MTDETREKVAEAVKKLVERQKEAEVQLDQTKAELKGSLRYGVAYLEKGYVAEELAQFRATLCNFLRRTQREGLDDAKLVEILRDETSQLVELLLNGQTWDHTCTDALTNLTYTWKAKASRTKLSDLLTVLNAVSPEDVQALHENKVVGGTFGFQL